MSEKKNEDIGYRVVLRGMQGILRILGMILIAIILIVVGKQAYTVGYQVVNTGAVDETDGVDVPVTITDDMSVMDIGRLLKKNGLINEDPVSFWIQEYISDYHDSILPGEYTLNTGETVEEMLKIMAQQDESEEEES